jgi:hypothetical protein
MAIDLWREKCIESCDRKTTLRGWIVTGESRLDYITFNEWTRSFVCHIHRRRVRPMSRASQIWSAESARQVTSKLKETLLARADILSTVLNPSLRSALAMLGGAKNLTSSELLALNSVIGRGSIQKEFDIEAFYARLDETDS